MITIIVQIIIQDVSARAPQCFWSGLLMFCIVPDTPAKKTLNSSGRRARDVVTKAHLLYKVRLKCIISLALAR